MNADGLARRDLYAVSAVAALALAPHALRFGPGLAAAFGTLVLWRLLGAAGRLPLPGRGRPLLSLVKHVIGIGTLLGVLAVHHGQLGRDAGVTLLAVLLGLKTLEASTERDFYVLSFIAYFLVATNFFYSQSMLTAGYMTLVVLIVTAGLVRHTADGADDARASFALAARLVAQSLPLMIIAFLLFPRLPGPLWGLPQRAGGAVAGLAEELSLGGLTSLALTDELAFSVAFEGEPPRARDLYWRGPVLWDTDGTTWRAGQGARGPVPPVIVEGPRYRYTITLEPSNTRNLLLLDAATNTGDAPGRATADSRLLAARPLTSPVRYTLESATAYRLPAITPGQRAQALALPPGFHPRARAFAEELRAASRSTDDFVARTLAHFHDEPFKYSLTPPPLTGDAVDAFLFGTREGFCEHYAAAFTVLMRAGGVPARLVTGYQGGEFNAISDYFQVRQRDAHAWVEIYGASRGWVRVDPTAAVAPERVSLGLNAGLARNAPRTTLDADAAPLRVWRGARALWDAANYRWGQWVLGFEAPQQRALVASLGLPELGRSGLALLMIAALAIGMAGLALFVLRARTPPRDRAAAAYARFCARLARAGLVRRPAEGPRDFATRVAAARADLAAEVGAITDLYVLLRYADAPLPIVRLERRVRNFRVNPR
ncbi:MAG: DUF3488 domain-containing transglutaminase family protein [Gammaproteobacteria bacterium]|nr:DUF3488 domain-containing transglutaminase family protein [Gammaproteobacteria bacterium]